MLPSSYSVPAPPDPIIMYVDKTLGHVYSEACKQRNRAIKESGGTLKTPVSIFAVDSLEKALLNAKEELLVKRQELIKNMTSSSENFHKEREKFKQELTSTLQSLNEAEGSAKQLENATITLSTNFSKIAEKLKSSTGMVKHATEIAQIIECILIFNEDVSMEKIEQNLRKTNFPVSNLHAKAEFTAKLLKIVNISEQNAVGTARKNLTSYKNDLSAKLLAEFKKNLENIPEMTRIVKSLSALESLERAIDLFICNITLVDPEKGLKYHYMPSDGETPELIAAKYKEICDFFTQECRKLWPTINIVFDRTQNVKQDLLQKVFKDIFRPFIFHGIGNLENTDQHRYCVVLEKFYTITHRMLTQIWELDNQHYSSSKLLDTIFQDFQDKYPSIEKNLMDATMRENISYSMSKLEAAKEAANALSFMKKNAPLINPYDHFDDALPNTILAEGEASWKRCYLLCPPDRLEETMRSLMHLILEDSLKKFLLTFLTACNLTMKSNNDKSAISNYLRYTSIINTVVLRLEEIGNESMKQIFISLPEIGKYFHTIKDSLTAKLSSEVVSGLQTCIDIAITKMKTILSTYQKKNDYIVTGETIQKNTEACQLTIKHLSDIVNEAKRLLSGDNQKSFLAVFGRRAIDELLTHLKSMKYNMFGAMVLIVDVTEYKNLFDSFEHESISQKISDLQQAANLMGMNVNEIKDSIERKDVYTTGAKKIAMSLLPNNTDHKSFELRGIFN